MRMLLDAADAERGLRRLAGQIIERHRGTDKLLLVGIRRGGVPVAERLAKLLQEHGSEVPVGTMDISLYRDDAGSALPNPRIGPTRLPIVIDGYRIILCDDVLYTGRTIRAALDALVDYGRPSRVELAVLLDRDGRELPIQADYWVKKVEVSGTERVDVFGDSGQFSAYAVAASAPSMPPPALQASQENQP